MYLCTTVIWTITEITLGYMQADKHSTNTNPNIKLLVNLRQVRHYRIIPQFTKPLLWLLNIHWTRHEQCWTYNNTTYWVCSMSLIRLGFKTRGFKTKTKTKTQWTIWLNQCKSHDTKFNLGFKKTSLQQSVYNSESVYFVCSIFIVCIFLLLINTHWNLSSRLRPRLPASTSKTKN